MKSAICMVVKNEARDIMEWIAFHRVAGFDAQIIFDNCSVDLTRDYILAAARLVDVRYHHWPQNDHNYQLHAYFTACQLYREEFDWIAFVDSDEFVVVDLSGGINELLARFGDCGGIAVNWAVYGSSGYQDYPQNLLTEAFVRRSRCDFFPNRHVKSIVRPAHVIGCQNPHWFELDAPYLMVDGRPLEWFVTEHGEILRGLSREQPDFRICRINHYFTRSRAHWDQKMKRGYPADIAVRKLADFIGYDRNEELDGIASRHAAAVRRLIAAINAQSNVA